MPETSYEPVLSANASTFLVGMSRPKQRELISLLFKLAEFPNQSGDYETMDEVGREIQHMALGKLIVSYWPDHAVKELRITEINKSSQ